MCMVVLYLDTEIIAVSYSTQIYHKSCGFIVFSYTCITDAGRGGYILYYTYIYQLIIIVFALPPSYVFILYVDFH